MLGLLSYLSTTFLISNKFLILGIPIALVRILRDYKSYISQLRDPQTRYFYLFMSIAVLYITLIFFIKDSATIEFQGLTIIYPYLVSIPIVIAMALTVRRVDFIIILILFAIEVFVGIAEYSVGVRTFFSSAKAFNVGITNFGDTNLLYYNVVYGLSDNSSVFAFKTLTVIGILYVLSKTKEIKDIHVYISILFVVVALLLTFNRTVLVAVGIFLFYILNVRYKILLFFLICVAFSLFYDNFVNQFFRGVEGNIDLSGRDNIFHDYWLHIKEEPFFGNFGVKLWLDIDGKLYHAHNSYIELYASNGFIVSSLFLLSFFCFIRFKSFRAILLLFGVYSLFQYGVFWGISFSDLIFISLLIYLAQARRELNV